MPIESLDNVHKGDWLICEKGPSITRYPQIDGVDYGEPIITEDKSFIGSLFKVVAISPPVFLATVFYIRDKKPLQSTHPFHWSAMKWTKANKTYVSRYLKMFKSLPSQK